MINYIHPIQVLLSMGKKKAVHVIAVYPCAKRTLHVGEDECTAYSSDIHYSEDVKEFYPGSFVNN